MQRRNKIGNYRHPGEGRDPLIRARELAQWIPAFAGTTAGMLSNHSEAERSRSALLTTVTELRLIAALAIIGFNNSPVNG